MKAKKLGIGKKWGKNQLNRIAVSNIKWFNFWIKRDKKMWNLTIIIFQRCSSLFSSICTKKQKSFNNLLIFMATQKFILLYGFKSCSNFFMEIYEFILTGYSGSDHLSRHTSFWDFAQPHKTIKIIQQSNTALKKKKLITLP